MMQEKITLFDKKDLKISQYHISGLDIALLQSYSWNALPPFGLTKTPHFSVESRG